MSRLSRIMFVFLACLAAGALGCADPSPTGADLKTPAILDAKTPPSGGSKSGLLVCSQTYDSVSKVIGPNGDTLRVGNHIFWVDSLVLTSPVMITAVAPRDSVRWVRFEPSGLLFPPSAVDQSYGLTAGALLYTNYDYCGVPTSDTLRVAQVSDNLSILAYMRSWYRVRKNYWSRSSQYTVGQVPHFSNYAIAW